MTNPDLGSEHKSTARALPVRATACPAHVSRKLLA
jgi:hypothetical protein